MLGMGFAMFADGTQQLCIHRDEEEYVPVTVPMRESDFMWFVAPQLTDFDVDWRFV